MPPRGIEGFKRGDPEELRPPRVGGTPGNAPAPGNGPSRSGARRTGLARLLAWPLYGLYERYLLRQVRRGPVPRHVGLILDGNRRFGRAQGFMHTRDAYSVGADKLDELLDWCVELGIPAITLWVFSTDNFSRPSEELTGLMAVTEAKLQALARDPRIHSRRIRVCAVGRLDLLPESTVAAVRAAEAATQDYGDVRLTLAAAYGGREEITDAVQALLRGELAAGNTLQQAIEAVTPERIGRYLYAPDLPEPDLIIRTSGEVRLSGFMLWQSVYSEFYFTDIFWPAFRRIDFLRAVRSFQQRNRRFGS
ncbi:MAG: di-trans,poly-cis-decaprenylcistransferase [Nevskia sp.]|nr:di-trans,poly-cis-decaprenylcistransferase [Nevskia sp.]